MNKAKEQIKFNTEVFKLMVSTLIGMIAGVIALLLSEPITGTELAFITMGLLSSVTVILFSYRVRSSTQRLIDALHD